MQQKMISIYKKIKLKYNLVTFIFLLEFHLVCQVYSQYCCNGDPLEDSIDLSNSQDANISLTATPTTYTNYDNDSLCDIELTECNKCQCQCLEGLYLEDIENSTSKCSPKGLPGFPCKTTNDCVVGVICNKTICACPSPCEYIEEDYTCDCGEMGSYIIYYLIGIMASIISIIFWGKLIKMTILGHKSQQLNNEPISTMEHVPNYSQQRLINPSITGLHQITTTNLGYNHQILTPPPTYPLSPAYAPDKRINAKPYNDAMNMKSLHPPRYNSGRISPLSVEPLLDKELYTRERASQISLINVEATNDEAKDTKEGKSSKDGT